MRRYQGEVSRDQEGISKYKYRKLFSNIYTTIGFINLVSCKSKFHLVRVTSTRIRFFSITERIS